MEVKKKSVWKAVGITDKESISQTDWVRELLVSFSKNVMVGLLWN